MVKPTKLKTKAQLDVPQTRDAVASAIHEIGVASRDIQRIKLDIEDVTANLTKEHQPTIDALNERIANLSTGVQSWCEANRDELTGGNKVKYANLITGEVKWRQNPPSVRVSKAEQVIEMLKKLGLGRFIRTKEEINKDAIIAEPDSIKGIAGLSLSIGTETFEIVPFEQDIAA